MAGKGWVEAGDLGVGTSIVTRAGPPLVVKAVGWQRDTTGQHPFTVYNLTVADDHTYFAGGLDGGLWAHNLCDPASPSARTHILDGDANGGGHRFGTGNSGKTEFPSNWTDDEIMNHVSDIATDPDAYRENATGPEGSLYTRAGNPARIWAEGVRDGVYVRVLTEPAGDGIITAFPPWELGYPVNP